MAMLCEVLEEDQTSIPQLATKPCNDFQNEKQRAPLAQWLSQGEKRAPWSKKIDHGRLASEIDRYLDVQEPLRLAVVDQGHVW